MPKVQQVLKAQQEPLESRVQLVPQERKVLREPRVRQEIQEPQEPLERKVQ